MYFKEEGVVIIMMKMVELQIKHRVGNMTLLKSDCAVEKNVANAKISGGDDYDLGNFS